LHCWSAEIFRKQTLSDLICGEVCMPSLTTIPSYYMINFKFILKRKLQCDLQLISLRFLGIKPRTRGQWLNS